jgi:succinate dehydrogenase / fumarate reductase flavoprotein subunit/fumarate reductase flavoprotein subunit
MAGRLVTEAPGRVLELESRYGCLFDRNASGRIHQKPFAGQTHDRTVHKGDLTGIEIMNRLTEQAQARPSIRALEECRAIELLCDDAGRAAGALVLDIRTGRFVTVRARATLLATGGGPTMYRVIACSADKAADGIALAYRAGLTLRDMEMIQFHPTGLFIPGSLMTGALLEEGLRGAGGQLRNGLGERFMARYDPVRLERSTRDLVSRASFLEVTARHTQRRRLDRRLAPRRRGGRAQFPRDGATLPRLRPRPRARAPRGRSDGAFHDGRRRRRSGLSDGHGRPLRGR